MLIDVELVTKQWKEQGNIHKFGIQISPHWVAAWKKKWKEWERWEYQLCKLSIAKSYWNKFTNISLKFGCRRQFSDHENWQKIFSVIDANHDFESVWILMSGTWFVICFHMWIQDIHRAMMGLLPIWLTTHESAKWWQIQNICCVCLWLAKMKSMIDSEKQVAVSHPSVRLTWSLGKLEYCAGYQIWPDRTRKSSENILEDRQRWIRMNDKKTRRICGDCPAEKSKIRRTKCFLCHLWHC
jgi:hypothetical protein